LKLDSEPEAPTRIAKTVSVVICAALYRRISVSISKPSDLRPQRDQGPPGRKPQKAVAEVGEPASVQGVDQPAQRGVPGLADAGHGRVVPAVGQEAEPLDQVATVAERIQEPDESRRGSMLAVGGPSITM